MISKVISPYCTCGFWISGHIKLMASPKSNMSWFVCNCRYAYIFDLVTKFLANDIKINRAVSLVHWFVKKLRCLNISSCSNHPFIYLYSHYSLCKKFNPGHPPNASNINDHLLINSCLFLIACQ